jgi:iron complex transport system substrate-binding protein
VLKHLLAGLFIAAVLAGALGCGGETEAGLYTNDFTDQLGRTVHIESIPQRIISLAPSNTEILFALGLDDRIVGVTEYCDYPEQALSKDKIGGFWDPNEELIVSLKPDLVVAQSLHMAEVVPNLEQHGIPVLVLEPLTLEEVLNAIILVGDVTGTYNEASRLVETLNSRIQKVTEKVQDLPESEKPGVFFLTWHDPLYTVGYNNLGDDLITKAGGINIFHSIEGGPAVTLEEVINANPDVIIAGVGMGTGGELTLDFAMEEPRLANTNARLNNRIYSIDIDLIGRAGPRMVDALEILFEAIHPELAD